MSTKHTHEVLETELPRITRHDLARFVKKGRRLRDGEIDKLSRSMGRGMVRLSSALAQPITAAIGATGLPQRIALARLWRREFRKARAELESYSERELEERSADQSFRHPGDRRRSGGAVCRGLCPEPPRISQGAGMARPP